MDAIRRSQRVATLIRAELARVLIEEVADPALSQLHINEVELSKDLKAAKVFFSPGESTLKPKDIKKGLGRALPFFRRKLADNLDLRYVPTLEFEEDKHGETVSRVFSLLNEAAPHDLLGSKDLETT